jgi:hypothetical protein
MVKVIPAILEFNNEIKIENMPKKTMSFCHKCAKKKKSMILISYNMIFLKKFVWTNCKFSILFGRFNFEACNL